MCESLGGKQLTFAEQRFGKRDHESVAESTLTTLKLGRHHLDLRTSPGVAAESAWRPLENCSPKTSGALAKRFFLQKLTRKYLILFQVKVQAVISQRFFLFLWKHVVVEP